MIFPRTEKRGLDNEQRLSLTGGDSQEIDKSGDAADTDNFRPPTKAPLFVNDFTVNDDFW